MAETKEQTTVAKQETKPEAKKENWLNWLAITTIIFSAAATLSTFRGGGLSTRAVLSQSNASDSWAYFQAKSVKQHTYDIQKEMFQIQALGSNPEQAAAYKKKIEKYDDKVRAYAKDKISISCEAKALEAERTRCQDIGGAFGLAVPYLQVAIMLSALAALMKKKAVWVVGIIPGAMGLAYFAIGYLLYQTVPPIQSLMVYHP